jgi:hypothetical protein
MNPPDPASLPLAPNPVALPPGAVLPAPFTDLSIIQARAEAALARPSACLSQLVFLWSPDISAGGEAWPEGSLRWLPAGATGELRASGPLPAHGGGLVCGLTPFSAPAVGGVWVASEVPRALAPGIDLRLLAGTGFSREAAVLGSSPCALAVCRLARRMRFEFRAEYPQRALYVVTGTVMLEGESLGDGTLRLITGAKSCFIDALEPSVLVLLAG